uniref:7TM_GPCR_Srx domain-containing protein n=1 Tax=Heterorhabditis bacteriophora TaxID=37862 RepID=A0A1I7WIZ5_HETBA
MNFIRNIVKIHLNALFKCRILLIYAWDFKENHRVKSFLIQRILTTSLLAFCQFHLIWAGSILLGYYDVHILKYKRIDGKLLLFT